MCPDAELLSAYFDNEVPSPWSEKLARHIDACPQCQAKLAEYRALTQAIAPRASLPGQDAAKAALLAELGDINVPKRALGGWWKHPLQVPLPLAVAALLAVAVVPTVSVLAFSGRRPTPAVADASMSPVQVQAQGAPVSTQDMVNLGSSNEGNFDDIESLLQYLDSTDSSVTVNIELPKGRHLNYSGTPQFKKINNQGKVEGIK
jgi:anti-sigma factor RsiW